MRWVVRWEMTVLDIPRVTSEHSEADLSEDRGHGRHELHVVHPVANCIAFSKTSRKD